ncbi:MAG: 4Fe-4S binding protein [Coriobacteriia bacterium]|nr:4Fe-4S binding protein [Coriobacteriia bacterium]
MGLKETKAAGYRTANAQSSNELRQGYPGRRPARIPVLQSDDLNPVEYARSTCFAAGYLTVKNAGWRNLRPVLDLGKCTGCLKCYMQCPDGAIFKVGNDPEACPNNRTDTTVGVDLDFCKGCGICARACAAGAISMVSEGQARKEEEQEGGVA